MKAVSKASQTSRVVERPTISAKDSSVREEKKTKETLVGSPPRQVFVIWCLKSSRVKF